jgi:2-polyprenyl-6-methoxyphenol hydroxylase-like FAD-dependent oxidoreductase
MRSITVAGAGAAGLTAALLLARQGHYVTVLERDDFPIGAPQDAPGWNRRGIPHFLQPHAFIPRARRELREQFPDVYRALIEAGAQDVDLRRKLPGPTRPEDGDLQYLAVRRPVIEWALRRAVAAESRIDVRSGVPARGLAVEAGRVTGVRTDDGAVAAEAVVDALGRRTPVPAWLAEAGIAVPPPRTNDCGVVYYSRYYRQRPDFELPDGPWFLSPRGDVGYMAYSTFPGDNRTFGAVLAVPSGVPEWRAFRDAATYQAAVARFPALRSWVNPDGVDPITPVLPMAGLRNSLVSHDRALVAGLFPVGDALCHTDPTFAHGLAFSIIHAAQLTAALDRYPDLREATDAYLTGTRTEIEERHTFISAMNDQRHRMWIGEPVDFAHSGGAYALFSMMAAAAVAAGDPEVFRAFNRRIGLLDSTAVLDRDLDMRRRIEDRFAEIRATPRPALGPSRDEMVALTAAAVATGG